jgi:hypothetical protein
MISKLHLLKNNFKRVIVFIQSMAGASVRPRDRKHFVRHHPQERRHGHPHRQLHRVS